MHWEEFAFHVHLLQCSMATIIHKRLTAIFTDACTAASTAGMHDDTEAWRAYDELLYGRINMQLHATDIHNRIVKFMDMVFVTNRHSKTLTRKLTQLAVFSIDAAARVFMTTIRTYPLYVTSHSITANYTQLYDILVCALNDTMDIHRGLGAGLDEFPLCPMHKIVHKNFTVINGVIRNRDVWIQMQIALMMAHHPRLGIHSPVGQLHAELLSRCCTYT